jgi:hypothetical protein
LCETKEIQPTVCTPISAKRALLSEKGHFIIIAASSTRPIEVVEWAKVLSTQYASFHIWIHWCSFIIKFEIYPTAKLIEGKEGPA